MFQRLLTIFSVAFLFSACETAPKNAGGGSGSSASGSSSSASQMTTQDKLAQVGNTVFFGFDSAELSSEAKTTLDNQSSFLNLNPTLVVVVEGHADERGTREYNLALGDRRAVAVRDYLLAKGLNAARVRTVSYGKERPSVSGSAENSWAQNRRAATVLN